jgi:serine/threonine-protein kinase RsbW
VNERPAPNEATVAVRKGPLVGPVLGRVVGMLAARAQCPIDRLDDAMLLTDAVAAHAPAHTDDGHVRVTVAADEGSIELRVRSLSPDGASGLLSDADLPGVGNVFQRVADEVDARSAAGEGRGELVLRLRFAGA